jgi:hypothetical protein
LITAAATSIITASRMWPWIFSVSPLKPSAAFA